jgi:hypothetical protein
MAAPSREEIRALVQERGVAEHLIGFIDDKVLWEVHHTLWNTDLLPAHDDPAIRSWQALSADALRSVVEDFESRLVDVIVEAETRFAEEHPNVARQTPETLKASKLIVEFVNHVNHQGIETGNALAKLGLGMTYSDIANVIGRWQGGAGDSPARGYDDDPVLAPAG